MKEEIPNLKQKYKNLKQQGKEKESFKVLQQIWAFYQVDKPKEVIKPIKEIPSSKDINPLDELTKVKGIGKKNLSDIKKIYSNVDELKQALIDGKVPLRDDKVEELKIHFKIN